MSDHNKCPSSEKEHEKCIFGLSYFHRIQPNHSVLAMNLREVPESTFNKEKSLVGRALSEHCKGFAKGLLTALVYTVLAGLGSARHGPHPRLMTG